MKLDYRKKRDTDCNALLNYTMEKQFAGESRILGSPLGPTVNSHVIFRNPFPPQPQISHLQNGRLLWDLGHIRTEICD